jgi:hypothetical protein
MTPEHLAELQAAWPGVWAAAAPDPTVRERTVTDRALAFAYIRDDSTRVAGIELRQNAAVFVGHGPDFNTAIAVAKAKFAAFVAPYQAALDGMP